MKTALYAWITLMVLATMGVIAHFVYAVIKTVF